jgi:hypothetical protein
MQTHGLEGLRKTAKPLNKVKLHVFTERELMTKLNNGLERYERWGKGTDKQGVDWGVEMMCGIWTDGGGEDYSSTQGEFSKLR